MILCFIPHKLYQVHFVALHKISKIPNICVFMAEQNWVWNHEMKTLFIRLTSKDPLEHNGKSEKIYRFFPQESSDKNTILHNCLLLSQKHYFTQLFIIKPDGQWAYFAHIFSQLCVKITTQKSWKIANRQNVRAQYTWVAVVVHIGNLLLACFAKTTKIAPIPLYLRLSNPTILHV